MAIYGGQVGNLGWKVCEDLAGCCGELAAKLMQIG